MRPACVRTGGRSRAAGRGRPPSHAPSSDPREPAARPQSPRAARPGRLLRQLPFPLMPPQSPRVTRSSPLTSRTAAPQPPAASSPPPRRTAAPSPPPRQAHRRAHPTSPLLSTRQLAGSKMRFFWQAMTGLQRLFRHQELLSQGGGIATWGFQGRAGTDHDLRGARGAQKVANPSSLARKPARSCPEPCGLRSSRQSASPTRKKEPPRMGGPGWLPIRTEEKGERAHA